MASGLTWPGPLDPLVDII